MPQLVKKPISLLDREVTVSWKELWKGLGKAVAHIGAGKFADIPGDLVDVGAALGLAKDPGGVAWLLVRRALGRAIIDLLREHRDLFTGGPPDAEMAMLEAGLDISDEVLELDETLFKTPGELELLGRLKGPFARWLVSYGIAAAAAQATAERLPVYFVLALHDEWGQRAGEYAVLSEVVKTPFTQAQDMERAWLRYEAHLWRQVNEPMFAEAFGLKAVYVPLRAYWQRGATEDESSRTPQQVRVVVDLHQELDAWLENNQRDQHLRVISGGPGSGKSSFARMYAAATMTRGRVRALYIPLHLLDLKGDLIGAVGDYVRSSGLLPQNPLGANGTERARRLLLVFDGLDELAMQGKLAEDTARDFVRELDRTLERLNQMSCWVSALVSGRELVVQANASELRRSRQVLHLMSYRESTKTYGVSWEDPESLVNTDQREVWWTRYCAARGEAGENLPQEFSEHELSDVTAQPLLLYLVALSHARGTLAITPNTNLNDVYADLIEAVWERAWERRRFVGIQGLEREQFRRVLEEIGLTAWHDERRTTTVAAIQRRFETAALTGMLRAFQQGAERGVTRLLAAFYFRQYGEHDGERTFEFTHKSFGEYLAASRIVRTLRNLDRDMTDHEAEPDRGKDAVAALVEWVEVCGPASLDQYYARFLEREIQRQPIEDVRRWHRRLMQMMTSAVTNGTPVERIKQRPATFRDEMRRARNADEALFAAAAACAAVTKARTEVRWPTPTAAGEWLRRLQGQRSGSENRVVLASLRWLDLSSCVLHGLDLLGAELSNTRLERAGLGLATLVGTKLLGANLAEAHLVRANFWLADLRSANLTGANVTDADLRSANLEHADLRSANLEHASLTSANLKSANLASINLHAADLTNTQFDPGEPEKSARRD